MENEILSLIELLKSTSSTVYPMALHAATVAAITEICFGSLLTLGIMVLVFIAYKRDWDEVSYVIGFTLSPVTIGILILGIYEYNTLEYQAFKMLLGR